MSTADNKKNRKFAGVKYRIFHRCLGILCLKLADKLVAVSKYELDGLSRYVNKKSIKLIYNSINTDLFSYELENKQKDLIITVSSLINTHYLRKGLDIFVKLSNELPNYKFVLIGKDCKDGTFHKIQKMAGDNFTITGSVSDSELKEWMCKASMYCQFSRQEGFGVALAEAMACGCIPIVSKYGAVPEVAGPDAYYIEKEINYEKIKSTIIKVSEININRELFSKRINSLFNDSKREKLLLSIVEYTL